MKQFITLILICSCFTVVSFGQTTRVATSSNTNNPLVYTTAGTDAKIKAAVDAATLVFKTEIATLKAQLEAKNAQQDKALTDSMGQLLPIDGVSIVAKNGNAISVVDVSTLQTSINTTNTNLSNLQASTDSRLNSLEGWRTTTNIKLAAIDVKIATIPRTAVSTSVSTTTTTTVTELKQ